MVPSLRNRRQLVAVLATAAAALTLALTVTGKGCSAPDATPDGAVDRFVRAARAGDKRAAYELLGPRTRAALKERARSATDKTGGTRRYEPLDMLEVGASASTYEPRRIVVRKERRNRAVVDVVGPAGQRDSLTVVREGSRWRVELLEPESEPRTE